MASSSEPYRLHPAGGMSAEEWRVRLDLAAAYRLVAHYGWDDLVATHLSARVPGPEHHFLINPFGSMFHEITASSLVKIDLDGNVIGEQGEVNAAGFTIHSAIHAAREDAMCVMHLHTIAGMGVSAQDAGLLPLNQTALLMCDSLAYHDYEGIALDHDEKPRLVADLGDRYCMMLRNHGTLTVGRNIAEAFTWMYQLERACMAQVAAMAGGGKLRMPSVEARATVPSQMSRMDERAQRFVWPALIRLVEKRYPDYRD